MIEFDFGELLNFSCAVICEDPFGQNFLLVARLPPKKTRKDKNKDGKKCEDSEQD